MKLITSFKNILDIFNLKEKDDPTLFKEVQKVIANAFNLTCAEDYFDDIYSYVASINRENNEIVSGYRHILCKNAHKGKSFNLNTFKYYDFSSDFSQNYADYTIELCRSFVNPVAKRKIWGLFSIWKCGLGPLINYQKGYNGILYILGQVSLKENAYDIESIKAILKMFWNDFGTNDLLSHREPAFSQSKIETFYEIKFNKNYKQDKAKLTKFLKEKEQIRPTLFLSYADLIDGKRNGLSCFLPIYNPLLKCYETGFLHKISEISPENSERYLKASYNPKAFG